MLKSYKHTKAACYLAYIAGAAVANFAPLLFLIFQDTFGLSLGKVTALITVNFSVQLFIDLIFSRLADRIGYRVSIVAAHLFVAAGLAGLALFPLVLPAFAGLITAVVLYAIGGGILEVLISPMIEACPTENKSGEMSLLHSFYCWGSVAVIALSTAFLAVFGKDSWRILAGIWAALPLLNAVYMCFVPIASLTEDGEGMSVKALLKTKKFWLFAALVVTSGAAEQAIGQWASTFAERGLGITKAMGDLLGPCLFVALMGLSRVLYPLIGRRIPLKVCLLFSGSLAICCYLIAGLVTVPALALVGCAVSGFAVGMLWPGTFSLAAETIPRGGTAMFAFLALAGDLGCMSGPTLVGTLADCLGGNLQTGILIGIIFPVALVILMGIFVFPRRSRPRRP